MKILLDGTIARVQRSSTSVEVGHYARTATWGYLSDAGFTIAFCELHMDDIAFYILQYPQAPFGWFGHVSVIQKLEFSMIIQDHTL